MYCPLHLNYPITCPKENCAWYSPEHNQCIVKLLASLYSEKLIDEIKVQRNFSQMQNNLSAHNFFDLFFPKRIDEGDKNGN